MATAQKEIPIDDAELDDLMAQLEAETANVVDAPAAVAAPVAAANDEVDELYAEIAAAEEPAPVAAGAATVVDQPDDQDIAELAAQLEDDAPFEPTPAPMDPDAELAALAAELDADSVTETPAPTPAPAPASKAKPTALDLAKAARAKIVPEPDPAPAPEPEPVVHLEGEDALKAVAESLAQEAPALRVAPAPAPAPVPAAAAAPKKELNHYIDMAEFRREISVSVTNLDNCMMEQASLRAYHGEQAAHAEAQHSRLKLRHEVVEARLYDKHRKSLAADPTVKVTEKMVENAVKQDPEYVASKNRVIEAETIAAVRRSCTDALKDRKDMLVQLGADRREEGKGQVRILAAEASHQDKRAMAAAAVGGLRSA